MVEWSYSLHFFVEKGSPFIDTYSFIFVNHIPTARSTYLADVFKVALSFFDSPWFVDEENKNEGSFFSFYDINELETIPPVFSGARSS